jgi:DNA-binding MarR family transcriptional regulator
MTQESKMLVRHILELSNDIFRIIKLSIPPEWLSSDLTVAQLRVLILLQTEGASHMSVIASLLGTTLSTVTGTADILVKKGLIVRRDDPEDRRVVICDLSATGQEIINRMWVLGQQQLERLLDGLSLEELKKAHEVAELLTNNVKSRANVK